MYLTGTSALFFYIEEEDQVSNRRIPNYFIESGTSPLNEIEYLIKVTFQFILILFFSFFFKSYI